MEPRWIGINGAFATKSPSGAKRAHEKSRRSLILVLMEVCCSDRPMASATLMNLFANRVNKIGSALLLGDFPESEELIILKNYSLEDEYYQGQRHSDSVPTALCPSGRPSGINIF